MKTDNVSRASPLMRQLLWRTAAFTGAAVLVLASIELWMERRSERADVHRRAVHATEQALASLEHAVWTYEVPNLRLAAEGLLRDDAISSVRIDSPEASMQLALVDPEERGKAPQGTFAMPLKSPDGRESIGTVVIGETYRAIDAQVLERIAYRLPLALAELLAVVLGLTVLTHRRVVSRVNALARQVQQLDAPGAPNAVVDKAGEGGERDEIGQLADAINDFIRQRDTARQGELARERAEASSAAKSELLSRIGHELRTPLNAIVGFAQALSGDVGIAVNSMRASRVELIGRAGRHLASLIDDLMDYSQLEQRIERVEAIPVDLDQLCAEALALVEQDAVHRGVTLGAASGAAASWVQADPLRLEQVLLNLLSNAIKYNRPGGHVAVRIERGEDGVVRLVVEDTGLGMSATQLSALYQPFNRLGREASDRPGTGIGLVISRRLVERMSGSLEVTSTEGIGTVFTVCLRPAAPVRGAAHRAPALAAGGMASLQTVLYVEDDPVNVEVMRAALSLRPDLTMSVAGTASEAAAFLERQRPALALLDSQLPDGNGLDLLVALRATATAADLPVIMVTGEAGDAFAALARSAGANAVMTKPFEFQRLLSLLDALLPVRQFSSG